jgi:hypothetical protein
MKIEMDLRDGRIDSIIIPGKVGFFGLLVKTMSYIKSLGKIKKIGNGYNF